MPRLLHRVLRWYALEQPCDPRRRAGGGDRFDLAFLGAVSTVMLLHGGGVLDAMAIESVVGRTGTSAYLALLAVLGALAIPAKCQLTSGRLMVAVGSVCFTLAIAAILVKGLEAFLPAAVYLVLGRRLCAAGAHFIGEVTRERG